jgi:hypothetical protein
MFAKPFYQGFSREKLTDTKEMNPAVVSAGESVNFDQFRMADALI